MTETKIEEKPVTEVYDHKESAEFLKNNCYSVEFEVSWFGTRRKATQAETVSMLKTDSDEIDPSQLTVDIRLFDPKDEHIKAMNQAKLALSAYRDSATIPAAKLPLVTGKTIQTGEEQPTQRLIVKKPGERIILAEDVDEFDNYVTKVLVPNLLNAVEAANDNIEQIKERAKKKLKKRFREDMFPERFEVGVYGPEYSEVGLSLDFEKTCPAAADRMKTMAEQRMADTVELAVADFANTFMETVAIAARQLSCRTKLMPASSHELAYLKDAEVLEVKLHEDEPDEIPEGKLLVEVAYKLNKKRVTEWFGPFTETEYGSLNPFESTERCKVYESTFEKLLADLDRFNKIRGMLGDLGKPLDNIVEQVSSLLHNAGNDARSVVNEVKSSRFFRNQGADILSKVADEVEILVSKMPVRKKGRRRAIGKLKLKK